MAVSSVGTFIKALLKLKEIYFWFCDILYVTTELNFIKNVEYRPISHAHMRIVQLQSGILPFFGCSVAIIHNSSEKLLHVMV